MEILKVFVLMAACLFFGSSSAGNFSQDVIVTWGDGRAKVLDGGNGMSLALDNTTGSGFESINQYLFARFDVQIKLVANNSAGTVTTFFLASQGPSHDEVDFEFLGNSSGEPYTVHTNVYTQGSGDREQQFRLWFDPTVAYHNYSILWNQQRIIFLVDNLPIRVFNNYTKNGVPFPTSKPMKLIASLWNAEDWATQGGRVKTDWDKAPFTAFYRNYNVNGCVVLGNSNSCLDSNSTGNSNSTVNSTTPAWQTQGLDTKGRSWIRMVQQKHMIYNYCTDKRRFPKGYPKECKLPRF